MKNPDEWEGWIDGDIVEIFEGDEVGIIVGEFVVGIEVIGELVVGEDEGEW